MAILRFLAQVAATLILGVVVAVMAVLVILVGGAVWIGRMYADASSPDRIPPRWFLALEARARASIDALLIGRFDERDLWLGIGQGMPVPHVVTRCSITPLGYRVLVLSDPTVMPEGAAAAGLDAAELAIETQLVCAGIRR